MPSRKSFKQAVNDRLAMVVLSPEVRQRIRQQAVEWDGKPRQRKFRLRRRYLTGLVAACLVLVFGVSVAAGAFPSFERFLQQIGEDLRGVVQQVEAVSVSSGIRMEVVAAANDGDSAVIYLAMKDEQQNRIDATTELLEYTLGNHIAQWNTQAFFDPEAKIATLRLDSLAMQPMAGTEVQLEVTRLLSGQTTHTNVETGLTLADVAAANPSPATAPSGTLSGYSLSYDHADDGSAAKAMETRLDAGTMPLLADEVPFATETENLATIESAGIVDGFLHIRYNMAGDLGLYSRLNFSLAYPGFDENTPLAAADVPLGKATEVGSRRLYLEGETILQLPQGVAPEEVRVLVSGFTYGEEITGNWRLAFTLDESVPKESFPCELELGGWSLHSVSVSPIGIKGYGSGEMDEHSESVSMEAYRTDGSLIETHSAGTMWSEDGIVLSSDFACPIPLEKIGYLVVNGIRLDLKHEGE